MDVKNRTLFLLQSVLSHFGAKTALQVITHSVPRSSATQVTCDVSFYYELLALDDAGNLGAEACAEQWRRNMTLASGREAIKNVFVETVLTLDNRHLTHSLL